MGLQKTMFPKFIHVLSILVILCFLVKSFPHYEFEPEMEESEENLPKRWLFHKRGEDGWQSFKFEKRSDWVPSTADEYYAYFHPNDYKKAENEMKRVSLGALHQKWKAHNAEH